MDPRAGGITQVKGGTFTLRSGTQLLDSPSMENSWLKTSLASPDAERARAALSKLNKRLAAHKHQLYLRETRELVADLPPDELACEARPRICGQTLFFFLFFFSQSQKNAESERGVQYTVWSLPPPLDYFLGVGEMIPNHPNCWSWPQVQDRDPCGLQAATGAGKDPRVQNARKRTLFEREHFLPKRAAEPMAREDVGS